MYIPDETNVNTNQISMPHLTLIRTIKTLTWNTKLDKEHTINKN